MTLRSNRFWRMAPLLCAAGLTLGACATAPRMDEPAAAASIDPAREAMALREAADLRAKGQRVWCVPFARNVSGINIRGNAHTWWNKAAGAFDQSKEPAVGAVMSFRSTPSMPLGHVAVVSEIVAPDRIRVDHANWHRDQVSQGMTVIDVSGKGDWSSVRLESNPDSFGSVYPVNGFILPPAQPE
ncbi:CHAP domain-containing protein [Pelagivirga sediminicola]|uniref:CHAP domain-containing protein n=1 Tax=Pelagivirga sediminicola TaxID=2170575 RepID=A0A2T7GBK1_9RHOB|nr:CHAP domain-containing protein [Pelagivirga sediminicola]PVA11758.1 CHAP domain-containing protein [Pelagivirga sediminicola]